MMDFLLHCIGIAVLGLAAVLFMCAIQIVAHVPWRRLFDYGRAE
jgi:hypothetical protein